MATTDRSGAQACIWDVASGKLLQRIPANKGAKSIDGMVWSGDGKVLAMWNREDHLIRLWDADTARQLHKLSPGADWLQFFAFSPDSKILAVVVGEGGFPQLAHLSLWTVETGRLLHSLEVPTPGSADKDSGTQVCVAFSPDGRTLAVGGGRMEASISLWEVVSGRRRLTLKQSEDVDSLVFSPDGKLLAAANNYITSDWSKSPPPCVHLWDVAAEKELPSL